MNIKQKVADAFVNFTHEWNMAMHNAIERKVFEGYKGLFPNGVKDESGADNAGKTIESMREFYYQRMVNTASFVLTGASLLIALIALLVALIAIHFS